MTSPIILAGMHRSGTSLVTRLLDDAGLFVGKELEGNHESVLFLSLNEWALRNAGASWDDPRPVRFLLQHAEGRQLVTDYCRRRLAGPRARAYFGGRRKKIEAGPWGWKDPRNTATLPIWMDVFPEGKVLIVDRHGVDVAQSLRTRFEKSWPGRKERYEKYAPTYRYRASRYPVAPGFRLGDLEGAFGTWKAYMQLADEHTAGLGDRLLRFRYEDLLTDPQTWLPKMFAFAGLDVDAEETRTIAERIDGSRAFAYQRKPELQAFADAHAEDLARWDYKP